MSYRDDLRSFVAWNSKPGLNRSMLINWCWEHFLKKIQHGTMLLEAADPSNFVGLKCLWDGSQLSFAPQIPDIFAGFCYSHVDSFPLMPWCSWIPPHQRINAVRGLLCRVFFCLLTKPCSSFVQSLKEAWFMLVINAGYPFDFVGKHCLGWAFSWIPKGSYTTQDGLLSGTRACIGWLEDFCIRHDKLAA